MMQILAWGLVLTLLASPHVSAQQAITPEPIVTATIDPPRVVVGQQATLIVTVLAPNYMPAPPAMPNFQLRNAVTRPLGAVNEVEHRDGVTYAGVRYEFAVFPQEAGSYAIVDQEVVVTFAADPPQTRTATIELPRLSLEAYIPEAAQDLDPFVAAAGLTLEQTVKQSSQDLTAGESLTRIVTIKADGAPAMLLPVTSFASIDGLALYPGQPSLQDNFDRRTSALTAARVDEAIYMLERPGDYTLPAIDLAWWSIRDGKVARAHIDAIALHVADNPAMHGGGGSVERAATDWDWRASAAWVREHLLFSAIALLGFVLIAWRAPIVVRAIAHGIETRRATYLKSEKSSFERLKAASRGGSAEETYFALLDWLGRVTATAAFHSIDDFKKFAQDAELNREIGTLETHLFGPGGPQNTPWSSRQFIKHLKPARRRLLRAPVPVASKTALPAALNPLVAYPQGFAQARPVAR